MRPTPWLSLATLLLSLYAGLPAHAQEAAGKLSVLFLAGTVTETAPGTEAIWSLTGFLPDETLQNHLAQAGVTWGATHLSTKMTLEWLKQFNVVVVVGFPMIEAHAGKEQVVRQQEQLLAQFVEAGGGVVFMGINEAGMWGLERDMEELNRFLKPFGAQVVHEQVAETSPTLVQTSLGAGDMGWTKGIAAHPVTEGVRGLLYPLDFAWAYYTHPVQVDQQWQVVVKGSPTASSYSVKLGAGTASGQLAERKAGAFAKEPPLLAVRTVGAGRMALWPTIPSPYVIDSYHAYWGAGMMMEGTNQTLPSDGRKLFFNLLNWLGEPSRGKLGGYQTQPPAGLGEEPGFQAVDWDKVVLGGKQYPNAYQGIIGLRSNLSTGTGTPQEMIAAAREAGYDFAAFAEDVAKLSAEKLASLKALCAQSCTDKFMVYPGFTYLDESGNSWLTFGPQMDWPKPDWFSTVRPGAILKNNFVFRGLLYPPVIMLTPGKNPEPAFLQGNFKGLAVQTYQAGKLVEDALPTYLKLQEEGFDLFPVAAHLVGSAAEVKAAAAAPFQTWVRWAELGDVHSALSGTTAMYKSGYRWHRQSFCSSGPKIEDFYVHNFGTADLAVPNNDRYRIYLTVSAEKGLKEVALYDGTRLYRRFGLNGEKEWNVQVEGYQDRNRNFIAMATDTAGGRVISGTRWTNVQELMIVRCTDNLNTYTSGKYKTVKYHALRGLESYIDQQAGQMGYFPIMNVPQTDRFAVDQQLTQVSRFGYVKEDVLEYYYPPTATPNWNATDLPELAKPQDGLKGKVRTTLYAPWAGGSMVCEVEGNFTTLRDLELPQTTTAVYGGQWLKDAETVYASRPGGASQVLRMSDRGRYGNGSLDEVEYVAQMAPLGGSRGVIPLSKGLTWSTILNAQNLAHLGVGLPAPTKKIAAGTPLQYRYLAVWSTVGAAPDNGFMEAIVAKLGLRDKTAYTVTATVGEVVDTRFALRLRAQNGGWAGTISQAKLPLPLPVYVEGLNERWPAGVLYKGQNELTVQEWRISKVGYREVELVRRPGENQLQRCPVLEGVGRLGVDTEWGDRNLFMGNLLVCDQPEVFLGLDDARPGKAVLTANNPTDRELTVTIRPGPGFDLLGDFAKTVKLGPGGYVKVTL